jgi:hypothetical protein
VHPEHAEGHERRLRLCHAEFVVVERSPDESGFRSRLPDLNIRVGWIINKNNSKGL